MKAAVLRGARDIVIEEVPEPVLQPDGVIIRVKACGICGSDVHLYQRGAPGEWIPGHEFSGDIIAVGANLKGVQPGGRVVAMGGLGCGECYWCHQGDWLRCRRMALLGYGLSGAFAEYVSIPDFRLGLYAARLPDPISYEAGATAEPLSVALYAVNKSQPQPGDTAVVIGAGVIGLCVIRILRTRGINDIIVSGRRAHRLELARQSGVVKVVDAAVDDPVPVVREVTGGRDADIVFECSGAPVAFEQSLQMVHRGGKVAVVGLYEQSIDWNPAFIVAQNIDLIGCGLAFDLPGAMELISSGKVDTCPLISHRFTLESIKEAFETQINAADAVKVVVAI